MSNVAVFDRPAPAAALAGRRLEAIDLLRGIVIALMVLDHVRDFFHESAFLFNPLDVEKTSAALYLTRWITHFCAPVFVFLAGVSAFLHGARLDSRAALSRFLLTRGLWLVLLEVTVVGFAWDFALRGALLQVIWVIGAAMVALAALVWLPQRAILAVGVSIIAGHNILDGIEPAQFGELSWVWRLLHDGGRVRSGGFGLYVVYPLLPWIGVMAAGYGLGFVFRQDAGARRRTLTILGLAMITGFLLLRGFHLYGDPRDWMPRAGLLATAGDFLDVRKYPPSLMYVLATLGPAFLLLPRLEQWRGRLAEVLLAFGRVPLFCYLLHLYLAHGLMLIAGVAAGYPASMFIGIVSDPRMLIMNGWGVSLAATYGLWLFVLALLYPACRWFGEIKRRRRDWWLSYL
ncbi:MAG TPA: heparan-alpha-glucosaminide N-acetyltransferase domain-containing protein [Paucimonas sp.]|nr:heparan-alpha-glucosaminide N-acetyltransferase domain-containing protein [Paucimonas sp.]